MEADENRSQWDLSNLNFALVFLQAVMNTYVHYCYITNIIIIISSSSSRRRRSRNSHITSIW